jgi:adenylylsulfate kinase
LHLYISRTLILIFCSIEYFLRSTGGDESRDWRPKPPISTSKRDLPGKLVETRYIMPLGNDIYSPESVSSLMSWVVWFTGLPGCGKTTIAQRVKAKLEERGIDVKVLELDEIRRFITPEPTYTDQEREVVYASLAYMAKLLSETGMNVIVDATANRRRHRDRARRLVPQFAEVYVKASLAACIERERGRKAVYSPKGIYERAGGEDATVPGVNVAYEEPIDPGVVVDAERLDPDQNADVVVNWILETFENLG